MKYVRKNTLFRMLLPLYGLCAFIVSIPLGATEKTIVLGSSGGWGQVEKRTQVEEVAAIRPYKVLALSSAWTGTQYQGASEAGTNGAANDDILALYAAFRNFPAQESALDLDLSFDEASPGHFADKRGRYRISVPGSAQTSSTVKSVNYTLARYGSGAVLFTGEDRYGSIPLQIHPGSSALFTTGRNVRDFSIEFWLYPNTMENGEQIMVWNAADNQRIICEALRNRIRWSFKELFAHPALLRGNAARAGNSTYVPRLSITMESSRTLVPRKWSHHLIRYNADTGLLEYLINGQLENTAHTTSTGRESGDVYTPLINKDGSFILGNRYSGMIDEFRIYNKTINAPGHTALASQGRTSLNLPELAKYSRNGGRVETRAIDLGKPGSTVHLIEASGGRFSSGSKTASIKNIYAGKNNFRFADNSVVQFFIRAGEEPYRFAQIPWIPIVPGEQIHGAVKGRYVQLAIAFYPSGDCNTTPYLEEVRIVYNSNEPPYPPSWLNAQALDGAVDLSWRKSPDENVRGYVVYYGTSSGVYYGQGAYLGSSPIDVGNRTQIRIEGLQNGTLYYFAIVAYNEDGPRQDGKFSREVNARPLRTGG